MNKPKRSSFYLVSVMAALLMAMLLTNVVSARRSSNNGWNNPACSEPSSKLSGSAYEEYIMSIRGTTTYEYIPANCPSCNQPAAPAPQNNDDDEEEEEYHPPAAPSAPSAPYVPPPPTPTPIPALNAALDAEYSSLVLFASQVGEPAQNLNGTISGGIGGPYTVTLHLSDPLGNESTYSLTTNGAFHFGATDAGDPNFGATLEGNWSAWMVASDSVGTSDTSTSAGWQVGWYPLHETP